MHVFVNIAENPFCELADGLTSIKTQKFGGLDCIGYWRFLFPLFPSYFLRIQVNLSKLDEASATSPTRTIRDMEMLNAGLS